MSEPNLTEVKFDTSGVVNPAEHLRGEIRGLSNAIDEVSGNIATLAVQKARLIVIRDAMLAGAEALYGPEPQTEDTP